VVPRPTSEHRRHTIDLYDAQAAFVDDTARFAAFVAGIGSGKTVAGAVKALLQYLVQRGRPTLGLVVAPTFGILRDATWRTCLEQWAPLGVTPWRSEMRIELATGHEVLFRSADDPDKLRGPNVAWAWIDEAAQCPAGTWPVVIGRLRQHGVTGRAWATTTPKGLNWVHEVFVGRAEADTALYRATTLENPFVERSFVESLRRQYSTQFARQELLGEFLELAGGVIRREWFRVVERAPDGLRWVRFWDLAASTRASADYTVGVRAALAADGTLYLADLIRDRWEWPDARRVILQALAAEPAVLVGVEAAGFQLAAFQDILRQPEAGARAIRAVQVDKDKLARAQPWIARAEAGKVPWFLGTDGAWFAANAELRVTVRSGCCERSARSRPCSNSRTLETGSGSR